MNALTSNVLHPIRFLGSRSSKLGGLILAMLDVKHGSDLIFFRFKLDLSSLAGLSGGSIVTG